MPRFKDGEMERIAGKFVVVMTKAGERLLTRAAVHVSANIIMSPSPGPDLGRSLPTDATRLTSRSGRLLRSVLGARGRDWTGPESIRTFKALRAGFRATVGTTVPYAGAHEFGTPAYTQLMTARQRRYFWAMYMNTKDAKWRSMAMAKGLTHKAYKGRPFMAPAKPLIEADIPMVVREEIKKEFGK